MSFSSTITTSVYAGPFKAFGPGDPESAMIDFANKAKFSPIKGGTVSQFNVGLYSASVYSEGTTYVCYLGAQNVTHGFGYSDINILREGDEVIFVVTEPYERVGMILARRPALYSEDGKHSPSVQSKTDLERRTDFFSDDCYRKKASAYSTPLDNIDDTSTRVYTNNRPTDMVPGETGILNQHRCGFIGGMYSTSLVGGGAHIRLFSLENRIRIVADSIFKCTIVGNENEWHNRRYLSRERSACLYQEERLGMSSKDQNPFEKADYHEDGYFTKNKKERQTARPRILEQEGYYANLSTRYCMRPDRDLSDPRTMDAEAKDAGVARESIDPSGQYRLAVTGMLGLERVGRIPVPSRIKYPWQKEVEEPEASALTEFKHDESHPYYRQLEHADRVAYDLKNSYARLDEEKNEFYTPEESDLSGKLKDIYDPGFTESQTVKLEKYDKRRSGIWQGEDGSIILRDAWGSEIVMIGGNIQISCAGNVETLPGKSALTLAGDDIIHKAQNSVDIESADKDVRINGYNNVQILAGVPDEHTGGITIEASSSAYPWDAESVDGGEAVKSTGILLKSKEGAIVTDTKNMVLRAREMLSLVSGEEDLDGQMFITAKGGIYSYSESTIAVSNDSALVISDGFAGLGGPSALVEGSEGAMVINGGQIPMLWFDAGIDAIFEPLAETMSGLMDDEATAAEGYTIEKLDKMYFRFRNTEECGTDKAWELDNSGDFTLYEPFWHQVQTKFETLKSATPKGFEDHKSEWSVSKAKNPWPGTEAVSSGKYAKLQNGPENIDSEGLNKARTKVVDRSSVTEVALFPGYQIRN